MRNRVAKLTGPARFGFFEEPLRPLETTEVLMRVLACGLCRSDMPAFEGKRAISVQRQMIRNGGLSLVGARVSEVINYPFGIGHEPVGVIEDKGDAVCQFSVGDVVAGPVMPGFGTYLIADASLLVKIPSTVSRPEYCLAEPLMCATSIIREASPKLGDYVAVVGCGVLGLLCLSGLKHSGAFELIAIGHHDFRLEWARRMGATIVLDSRTTDPAEAVREITHGQGADTVIEVSGSLTGLELACEIVRERQGNVLMASLYGEPQSFASGYNLMFRAPILRATHPVYSPDYIGDMRKGIEAFERRILPLDEMITHEFALDDIGNAFRTLQERPDGYLKGIVIP